MKQFFRFFQVMILVILWGGAQAQAPYCSPTYSTGCTFGDGLVLFQLGPINQSIPCSGTPAWYHDYTAQTATLQTGVASTVTIQSGYSSTYVTIWIDFNNNNAFETSEAVVTGFVCASSYTNYPVGITVPVGSPLGNHRLRYRTEWLSAPSGPCTSQSYGNSCDFTVNVILPPPVGTLNGTVTNVFGGGALNGVTVTVNALAPVQTNAVGFYSRTNVPSGTATVNATLAGFLPYTGTATIVSGQTTVKDFAMNPVPSYLTGIVTNGCNSTPVAGAKVSVGTTYTYTLPNGYYYFQAYPAGSQSVTVTKPGFIANTATVNIATPGPTTYNVTLLCDANPPGTVTAALNAGSTAVDINWAVPSGSYEIIYDDGGRENWTVWAEGGNMSAMKFTPIQGGVAVNAGRIHIGDASNYPAGTDPTLLAPFQMAVYDASGTGGTPGVQVGPLIDVIPANFGWNTFTFPTPVNVTGVFYLVMIQGGNPPNAVGLGVDETTNTLRSYSRFVTGGGPWLPASGNYMIRAVVTGQGGPLDIDGMTSKTEITANAIEGLIYEHTPSPVTGVEGDADYVPMVIPYTVWRLLEGQESNEALWGAPIASAITATSVTDASWPSLPDGPYRWAVKAGYPVNRLSTPVFSNVIGKNWTVAVTVNVSLTCGVTPVAGTIVKLQNTSFSQYVYTATTTATGIVSFPAVWKGTYDLTVSKIGYDTYTSLGNLIMGPMTFDVTLLQQKLAPSNMFVDNKSLFSTWNAPQGIAFLMIEDWASGSFATNQWTAEAVWTVYTGLGNPAPDAEFSWYPTLTNYSRSLTSKTFTGTGSPDFKLVYDIYLSDFLSDGNEQLDVEMQIGAGPWTSIKQYVNNGSMPWTTETLNIASVGSQSFKIRFRAHGVNSYNINDWDIDNIKIRSIAPDPKPCILAYNVYLNGVLDGVTLDTTYQIPPSHVTYNTVYQACVKAVYGSGYSAGSCYTFTSKFLYPPTNLQVEAVECAAYLTWEKPTAGKKVNVPAFKGTVEHTAASIGRAPVTPSNGDNGMPGNGVKGSTAFGIDATTFNTIDFDVDNVGGMTVIAGLPNTSDFWMDIEYPVSQPDWAWAVKNASDHLYKVDHATGAFTDLGSLGNGTTDQLLDLAVDPTSGSLFGVTSNSATLTNDKLWSINPATPAATLIGVTGSSGVIGLACDKAGGMYGQDIVADNLWSFDKVTGVATIVGPLGFNANYGQGMFYDEATDAITMCAFNAGTFLCEIRVVDIATGASTVLSSTGDQIAGATVPITSGGGAVKGLLGYKIYRDGTMVHQVGDPDTLFWYDFTVEPGTHTYGITALYDLSEYITPPPPPLTMFDESMVEGPVNVDIECGRELPFYEPWDQGSFSFNEWTLSTPTNGNWAISAATGNPAPAADFSWDPIQYDYSLSIQTPVLNGGPFTCAMIWCDFDYKLADRNSTGKEKLYMDVFSKGVWKKISEFANTASKDWTPMHADITTVKGKAFKVRFRAEGENSADILHWYVDNIHVYAKCNPPVEVSVADVADKTVTLTWNAPECGTAGPNPIWIHWDDGTNSDAIGTGGAVEFDIAARWDASQIVALDGGQVTKIAFYPAGSGVATYKLRVWEGPDAATLLVDQAVPSVTLDDWNIVDVTSPVPINVSKELWIGVNVNASSGYPAGCDAGPAVDGYGDMMYYQGAWATLVSLAGLDYNWNVQGYVESTDDHVTDRVAIPIAQNQSYKSGGTFSTSGLPSLNTKKFNPSNEPVADGRALLGYYIYRSDDMRVTYNKLNTSLWPDTSFVNTVPDYQDYYYYVTAVFPTYGSATCESDSSNVVKAGIVTGIDPMNGGKISIYPNPATDNVQVKSDFTITNIDVLNYIGQTVYTRQNVSDKNVKVNVANLTPGVYFVKVTTVEGIRTVKITVTR